MSDADARADLFAIMDAAPDGYDVVRRATFDGRIDSLWPNVSVSTRRGCFKAHLAEALKCRSYDLPGAACLRRNACSPLEAYMNLVGIGDTPSDSRVLKSVVAWLDEWYDQNCEL